MALALAAAPGTRARQLHLFKKNGTALADPAFTENREIPIHRWVPWIAGFSAAFVAETLGLHLPKGGVVLDPFAGVGTTLVETVLAGKRYTALGFEINPFPAMAAQTKVDALHVDPRDMAACQARFLREAPTAPPIAPPAGFRSRIPFFSPRVERQVLRALGWMQGLEQGVTRRMCLLAFGSTMVKFSNYTYEPSLSSRPAVDKALVEDAPVYDILADKMRAMVADLKAVQGRAAQLGRGQVYARSCLRALEVLEPRSVSLVVTSPPYANNYHYLRNTRPQLYWLNLASTSEELRGVEDASLGKFWQTVRDRPQLPLAFQHRELEELLADLRSKNADKGAYGGGGWANYMVTYFNDSLEFLKVLSRLLRRGGAAVIVIGNSIVQGINVKTDQILGEMAESREVGLHVESLEVARTKRVGNSIINSAVRNAAGGKASLYEAVLTLRKK